MKVIEGGFGKKACSDLSAQLRAIADDVDKGEIVDFVAAYVADGNYQFVFGSSIGQSLILAALMQSAAVNRFRE